MKQGRQVRVERDDAARALRQPLAKLEQRVERVEEGLEFIERLQPGAEGRQGATPRHLKGSELEGSELEGSK